MSQSWDFQTYVGMGSASPGVSTAPALPTPEQPRGIPRTVHYRGVNRVYFNSHRDLPLFTFSIIEIMLRDPQVRLCLQMRAAPIQSVEFAYQDGVGPDGKPKWTPGVKSKDPVVAAWVLRQLQTIWNNYLAGILRSQTWGWAAGEVTLRLSEAGLLEIDQLLHRHAMDCRLLELQNAGTPWGVQFSNVPNHGKVELPFPYCYFVNFRPENGERYSAPVLLGAYSPWCDKWLNGGALDTRRLYMHKDAYGGMKVGYPEEEVYVDGNENPVSARDIALQIVEQRQAGGTLTYPTARDANGNPKWVIEDATVASNPQHILQFPKDLDAEIRQGMEIPDGAISNDGAGSWEGKSLPLGAFYSGLDSWVVQILCDLRKTLEPLARMNFGDDVDFEICHKPLAQTAMEQQGQKRAGPDGGGEGFQGDPSGMMDDPSAAYRPQRMGTVFDPVEAVGQGVLSATAIVDAARRALDAKSPLRLSAVVVDADEADDTEDGTDRAQSIADILTHVFGDDAESHFDEMFGSEVQKMATWNAIDHPRGPNGRFIPKFSPEAVAAAKDSVKESLNSAKTPESAKQLVEHLSLLNGKQLRELKAEYGIAASGKSKQSLVEKIADRLDRGRRTPKDDAGTETPKADAEASSDNASPEQSTEESTEAKPKEPTAKEKKPFVYPDGSTQAFNADGSPAAGTEAKSQAEDAGADPREAAKAAEQQEDTKQEYEFARESTIGNRGEDLKNSARHKVNAWRGLAEAESDGTAEKLVTRDMLLKLEPHNLMEHADKNPLTALAMHYAMRAFPPTPMHSNRVKNTPELRKEYMEAYQSLKAKAEEIAATYPDRSSVKGIQDLQRHVSGMIDNLRKSDRYNNTANNLVGIYKALGTSYRAPKSGVFGKLNEFAGELSRAYGDEWSNAMDATSPGDAGAKQKVIDLASSHAKDIIEGKSLNAAFGKESKTPERKGFVPESLYGKFAKRTGGKDLTDITSNANKAVDHLVDEYGLRGVQWGNSVTDAERKHHAGRVVEAIADLADVTGLHPKDISLDGKLGLAIGARGHGRASAHYEPGNKVINLTRNSGVGALAHEWGHAFDHLLGGLNIKNGRGDYFSQAIENRGSHTVTSPSGQSFNVAQDLADYYRKKGYTVEEIPRDELTQSMESWAKAAKPFRDRVEKVVGKLAREGRIPDSQREYYTSTIECFARSFEVHVRKQLEKQGRENTYLSGLSDPSGEESVWPTDAEAEAMAEAFSGLMTAYRKKRHGQTEPIKFSLAELMQAAGDTEQDDSDVDIIEPPEEGDDQAEAIAEILTSLYGDDAEDMFDKIYGVKRMGWSPIDHPRGPNGRFIAKNSPEAASAAKEKITEALNGPRSPASLKTVTEHLSILTVKQLRELQKEHGIRAGGAKPQLVAKIADRLHGKVSQSDSQASKFRDDGTPKETGNRDIYTVPTSSLKVDPKRFQYKVKDIGEDGVTGELKGVSKWNPELAGSLLVWRDPADGQDYVINGHHRHELASRLKAEHVNARYIDAPNAKEARARGALANIAEGRGSAIDAAKYLRDSGQTLDHLREAGISMSGKLASDAVTLTDLNDKAFQKVAEGRLDETTALAVAKHLKDPALQDLLFKKLAAREDEGKDWSTREIETAARKMANAGKVTQTGFDLFGAFEDEKSTFDQEVELEAYANRMLKQEADDYRAVANKRRADRVSDAGNVLAIDENAKRADSAEQAVDDFNRKVHLRGPVNAVIQKHAADLLEAKTKKQREAVKTAMLEELKSAIRSIGTTT